MLAVLGLLFLLYLSAYSDPVKQIHFHKGRLCNHFIGHAGVGGAWNRLLTLSMKVDCLPGKTSSQGLVVSPPENFILLAGIEFSYIAPYHNVVFLHFKEHEQQHKEDLEKIAELEKTIEVSINHVE